jgi:hypothetical protein
VGLVYAVVGRDVARKRLACSVIFNPYGLEGIDMDWKRF